MKGALNIQFTTVSTPNGKDLTPPRDAPLRECRERGREAPGHSKPGTGQLALQVPLHKCPPSPGHGDHTCNLLVAAVSLAWYTYVLWVVSANTWLWTSHSSTAPAPGQAGPSSLWSWCQMSRLPFPYTSGVQAPNLCLPALQMFWEGMCRDGTQPWVMRGLHQHLSP